MKHNCCILLTSHRTIGAVEEIAFHSIMPANLLLFIPLDAYRAILISENNLDAHRNNSSTFAPFAMANDSSFGIAHLVYYMIHGNNYLIIKHYTDGSALNVMPVEGQSGAFAYTPEKADEYSIRPIPFTKYSGAAHSLKSAVNSVLFRGMGRSDGGAREMLLYDIILNYLSLPYLGAHNIDRQSWAAELEKIYAAHPCARLFKACASLAEHAVSIEENADGLEGLVQDYKAIFAKDSEAKINNVPLMINCLKKLALPPPQKRCCVVATARDEGQYLLEFIAYYRAMGVDDIFIYSNDNMDDSESLLNLLAKRGYIHYIANHAGHVSPQYKAYGHAFSCNRFIQNYEWALVVDLDEFLYINPDRYDSLSDFLDWHSSIGSSQISINWVLMNSDNQLIYDNRMMIERFRHGSPHMIVKGFVKPSKVITSSAHRGFIYPGPHANWRDASGNFYQHKQSNIIFSNNTSIETAGIMHYMFKSFEEFIYKTCRNSGDAANIKNSDFATRLTLNTINDFIRTFSSSSGLLRPIDKTLVEASKRELESILLDTSIKECVYKINSRFFQLMKIRKRAFIEYLDANKELKQKITDFVNAYSSMNELFYGNNDH